MVGSEISIRNETRVPHICSVLADVGIHGRPPVTLYEQQVYMSMVSYTLYTQGPKFVESHICQNQADMGHLCFLYAVPKSATCATFIKESRMQFLEANQLHRKYGIWVIRHSLPTRP